MGLVANPTAVHKKWRDSLLSVARHSRPGPTGEPNAVDTIELKNDGRPVLVQVVSFYEGVDPTLVDLSEGLAAACLNQRPKTLESWRVQGIGPRFLKYGRAIRYRLSDIIEFREKSLFDSNRDATTRDKSASSPSPSPSPRTPRPRRAA